MPVMPITAEAAYRWVFFGLLGLALTTTVLLGFWVHSAQREKEAFAQRAEVLEAELQGIEQQTQVARQYLIQMVEDPDFLNRIAREELGYAKPDEVLFRFEDTQRRNTPQQTQPVRSRAQFEISL